MEQILNEPDVLVLKAQAIRTRVRYNVQVQEFCFSMIGRQDAVLFVACNN